MIFHLTSLIEFKLRTIGLQILCVDYIYMLRYRILLNALWEVK